MTFDKWFGTYRPIINETGDSWLTIDDKNYTFETYGADLKRVITASEKTPDRVWTLIEGDDGELYIADGYHLVNRQGYFITEVGYTDDPVCIAYLD